MLTASRPKFVSFKSVGMLFTSVFTYDTVSVTSIRHEKSGNLKDELAGSTLQVPYRSC